MKQLLSCLASVLYLIEVCCARVIQ